MEKPHKRLDVWNKSIALVTEIYRLTQKFPQEERYGLTSQLRRAAISVPSNIAEGAARNTAKEFINFLHVAQGSLSELDTQIEIAIRVDYIQVEERRNIESLMVDVDKMLTGLIKNLNKKDASRLTPNALRNTPYGSQGFTLLEAIAVIVLLGIVGAGILLYFTSMKYSANPVIRTQAIELAQEKMERILADKKNSARGFSWIQNSNYPAENPVSGFSPSFNRSVDVFCVLEADLNTSNGTMPNCSTTGYHAKKVTVTVTEPGGELIKLITIVTDH